jgi:hypothetical protein
VLGGYGVRLPTDEAPRAVERRAVTAALARAVPPPLAPVIDALQVIARRYPVQGVLPGLFVDGAGDPARAAGWTPAGTVLSGDGLDDLLRVAREYWRTTPHVAAALAWKYYAYWVCLPAVLGYATARRVPLLEPDEVLLRYMPREPFLVTGLRAPRVAVLPSDALAANRPPGVFVVPDEAALRATLRATLLDRHLDILLDGLHGRVRLGRRTLLGSLASGVAHAVSRAADAVPGCALDVAGELLSTLDVADLVDLTVLPDGRLWVQRHTCCLAFALPTPRICEGCCLSAP